MDVEMEEEAPAPAAAAAPSPSPAPAQASVSPAQVNWIGDFSKVMLQCISGHVLPTSCRRRAKGDGWLWCSRHCLRLPPSFGQYYHHHPFHHHQLPSDIELFLPIIGDYEHLWALDKGESTRGETCDGLRRSHWKTGRHPATSSENYVSNLCNCRI